MTTTVAAIAAEAFDAVAEELSDVILSCTVTHKTQGAYDATTGAYGETTTTGTGRAVITTGGTVEGVGSATIKDMFPNYVAGPADVVILIEGLTALDPKENDTITIGSTTRTIKAAGDVVGAGSFFIVIAA